MLWGCQHSPGKGVYLEGGGTKLSCSEVLPDEVSYSNSSVQMRHPCLNSHKGAILTNHGPL